MTRTAERPDATTLGGELECLLGADAVDISPEALTAHSTDALRPAAVARPRSVAEIAEVLRWADRRAVAVTPWGGGTKQGFGRPLARFDVALRTDALSATREIDVGNLTAEVEGGLCLVDLQGHLLKQGLFFPLDPVDGAAATVGGTIAANASGPRRLLYRTARDQVLGLDVLLPSGDLLRTGGKTVKDVAGYNLTKPMIGSWGTLGVIVAATIRLLPIPEASTTVLVRFAAVEDAVRLAMLVRGSELLPAAMELCSENACRTGMERFRSVDTSDSWLLFGLEGHQEPVSRMARRILSLAEGAGALEATVLSSEQGAPLWEARQQAYAKLASGRPDAVRLRVSVPMSALGGLLSVVEQVARALGMGLAYTAHAGIGVAVVFFLPSEGSPADATSAAVLKVREIASGMGGFATVEAAPIGLRRSLDALPARDDFGLMRAVRQTLNPRDTLNPGKLA